jgi:uncharacterized SAM-binding protein YcdF (DUF218 family)
MNTTDIDSPTEFRSTLLRRFLFSVLSLAGLIGVLLGSVTAIHGYTMLEKTLTELVSPLGMAWVLLFLLVYISFLRRQWLPTGIGLICWLLLTLGGNSFVANWLISNLEAPYIHLDPFESGHFDAVIVLGGGTSYRSMGHSQFGDAGDRVGLAARLYHAGRCDRIICTGTSTYRTSEDEPHARDQSAELLRGLNVPRERIETLAGENTSQEMKSLAVYIRAAEAADKKPHRYGLLTSAAHLPRAMRLAKAYDLEFIPIPADVRGRHYRPTPNEIVPGAESLEKTKMVIKEYLGNFVGR